MGIPSEYRVSLGEGRPVVSVDRYTTEYTILPWRAAILNLYQHRAGISRIFGLFSIGTLGKGGGSKCGVRVGGLRLGLRVGVYTVTVTVSLGYFSI